MSELLDLGGHGLGRRYDSLDAGWRGAMLRAMGLQGADMQWVPGAIDAGSTETAGGLSKLADRVPPGTATARLPSVRCMAPRWSDAYRRLLGALMPEIEVGLRGCLGEAHGDWVRYRNAASPEISQRVLFRRWAAFALPQRQRRRAVRLFDIAARDPVSRARDAFGAMRFHDMHLGRSGALATVPSYGVTPAMAQQALFPLKDGRIVFDTERLAAAETGMLATGGARHPVMLPALRGDAFDPLERRLAAARITARGHVGARGVVPVIPGGWHDDEIVRRARVAGTCSTAWDPCGAVGGWSAFFGPTGTMHRHAAQLVVLSDMRLKIVFAGRFDETEQARLLAGLGLRAGVPGRVRATGGRAGGIWPFTIRDGTTALRVTATFDAAGSLMLDLDLPSGCLMFWGVRVGTLDAVT